MNDLLTTEIDLIAASGALGADSVAGLSPEESKLLASVPPLPKAVAAELRRMIRRGEDPLGSAFGLIRNAAERRTSGATYTPPQIVSAMMAWASEQATPQRIVDAGVGSGRFLSAAGDVFQRANMLGRELDPVAALMARGTLAAKGYAARSRIELIDYRLPLSPIEGATLFIGNPPYVRHHLIDQHWKKWLSDVALQFGMKASQLAGLHVHFFAATALHARPGDVGAFITAAEWMDVNYGKLVREMFLGPLGGQSIVVMEPTSQPFPDAATTAAITTFQLGSKPTSVKIRRVKRLKELNDLSGGRQIKRERLQLESRWSRLSHAGRACPEGYVELGELCRVHRGTVTGANAVFIAGVDAAEVPQRFKFRSVTKAREIIAAGRVLSDASYLRQVVDLPDDLDQLSSDELVAVEHFLRAARAKGADQGYVAKNRRAWWSVGLRSAAPILATYMARSAPTFVRNVAEARHINIAHGLYPREPLTEDQMLRLVDHLSSKTSVLDGRTYAGGLTKFEPGEMERLLVPSPALLMERPA
ncbi:TPA: class I SAM-dependent methyltransferase [Stenotrophomonas maltophilia]